MRLSPRGTTWRCACGQAAAPAAVLAIYRGQGQPRQAKTAAEQFASEWELATRQDAMHTGLDQLVTSGRLAAGSRRERLLRDKINDAKNLRQLEETSHALLGISTAPAAGTPPVITGTVMHAAGPNPAPAMPDPGNDEEDTRRTEWSAFLRAEAAKTGYFSSMPRHALPAIPEPGALMPARYAAPTGRTREACRLCHQDQAVVSAEHGDPTPALLSATHDGRALFALCSTCLAALQAAHPGTWHTTRLET